MRIMWCFFCACLQLTSHKIQAVDALAVDVAAFHGVNAGGVDGGVSEDVGKAHDVLVDGIKRAREKVAQVMRKHLTSRHVRFLA